MTRAIALAVLLALTPARALVVSAQNALVFDVSSVKRQQGNDGRGRGITVQPGGRFMAPSATVRELIAAAYDLQDSQITGGPGWIGADRFEVMGITAPDVTLADARAMLRTLLAERFRLAARIERREQPVYALELARDDRRPGEQLRPSGGSCLPPSVPQNLKLPPPPPPPPATLGRVLSLDLPPLPCLSMVFDSRTTGHWSIRSWPIERLAHRLSAMLGRPVFDRSGLTGAFDIDLTYGTQAAVVDGSAPTDVPALTTALREQLGLRLESTRSPVDVLVIDRVDPPADN